MAEYRVTPGRVAAWAKGKQAGREGSIPVTSWIATQPTRHAQVTHGSGRMVQTGHEWLSIPDKTFVMTGALRPPHFPGPNAEFSVSAAPSAQCSRCRRTSPWTCGAGTCS